MLTEVNINKFQSWVFSILKDKKIYEKTGCSQCNNTGYLGRVGIFSVLLVTPRIRKMMLDKSGTDAIENQARQDGMRTLLESAAEKVADGITSLEEMYRVVF